MTIDEIMFSDSGREEAARIAEACIAAGQARLIPDLLRAGARLSDAEALLANGAHAAPRPAAAAPAAGKPADSDLAAAAAARFAAQTWR